MSEKTKIEWTDHTFNPWIGCTKVSPGCANCYAETQDNHRKWTPEGWGKGKPRKRTSEANWKKLLKWERDAESFRECSICGWRGVTVFHGTTSPTIGGGCCGNDECMALPSELDVARPRVFCASLADWLDDEVPIEWLVDLLDLIRQTPHLDWLLLSKRPANWEKRMDFARYDVDALHHSDLYEFILSWSGGEWPENVWIGTSVEDQKRADERIPAMLGIPAKVRFLSCEPLLESVDLDFGAPCHRTAASYHSEIHWVIAGGESGKGARGFDIGWARSLRDQCSQSGVAYFLKQLGAGPYDGAATLPGADQTIVGEATAEQLQLIADLIEAKRITLKDKKGGDMTEWPEDLRVREFPNAKGGDQ